MTDTTTFGLLAALVAAVVSMQWFLLRETRASVNGLSREIRDLVLVIAIDVATRPGINSATRETAARMVKDRDEIRSREIEEHRR